MNFKALWRLAWRMLAAGTVGLLLYWVVIGSMQRSMIFPKGSARGVFRVAEWPGDTSPQVETLWLETDAGRTEYWLQLAPGASAEQPAGLVVFTHGNAELIDGQGWVFAGLRDSGYSVAMCEYRGYGRSDGDPSQADITEDHVAMLDLLLQRPDVNGERLVYFGRSIGTGVACSLAREVLPAGLVLISPFRSIAVMAADLFVPAWLVLDPFDNEATIEAFDGPVLLMHGKWDTLIPYSHSIALQTVGRQVQLQAFDCGHNDVPVRSPEVWQPITAFLKSLDE
jgi:pimeloyl-ACP methyl ester carboxylesterase